MGISKSNGWRKSWFTKLAASGQFDPSCAEFKGKCKGKTKAGKILIKKAGLQDAGARQGAEEGKKLLARARAQRKAIGASGEGSKGNKFRANSAKILREEIQKGKATGNKPTLVEFRPKGTDKIRVTVGNQGGVKTTERRTSGPNSATGARKEKAKEITSTVNKLKAQDFTADLRILDRFTVPTKRKATKGVSKEESKAAKASNKKLTSADKRNAGKTTRNSIVRIGQDLRTQARSAAQKGRRPPRQK
jgi:hypothetical protein